MFFHLLLLFFAFVPIWLPVLFGAFAKETPKPIRRVLIVAGVIAALYAAFIYLRLGSASGGSSMWGSLLVPIAASALSFYVAFLGVCVMTVSIYVTTRRVATPGGIFSIALVLGALVLGVLVLLPFLASPLQ